VRLCPLVRRGRCADSAASVVRARSTGEPFLFHHDTTRCRSCGAGPPVARGSGTADRVIIVVTMGRWSNPSGGTVAASLTTATIRPLRQPARPPTRTGSDPPPPGVGVDRHRAWSQRPSRDATTSAENSIRTRVLGTGRSSTTAVSGTPTFEQSGEHSGRIRQRHPFVPRTGRVDTEGPWRDRGRSWVAVGRNVLHQIRRL